MLKSPRAYRVLAVSTLAFTVFVILWGAFVRATGSGAGCGDHWPLCNGVVVPRAPALETVIEFTHRLTSGLLLLLTGVLVIAGFRAFSKGHPARTWVVVSAVFLVIEALIGAALVVLELVADNPALARGWWSGGHLANTFILVTAMTFAAWHGWEPARMAFRGAARWRFALAAFLLILVGVSGAVAALGNTLFPAESLAQGFRMDAAQESHPLVRLRVFHPLLAIVAAGWLLVLGATHASDARPRVRRFALLTTGLVGAQVLAGFVNLALLAPVWMQLLHLLLADAVLIAAALLAASVATEAGARD